MPAKKIAKTGDVALTEIVEADIKRVDGVLGPANGTPFLLMKSIDPDEENEKAGLKLGEQPVPERPGLAEVQKFQDAGAEVAAHAAAQDRGTVGGVMEGGSQVVPPAGGSGHQNQGISEHAGPPPPAENREGVEVPALGQLGPAMKAQLSSAEMNDLPDSAFAYIEPGGEKDAEGKTTPRSKRHFAIHDKAHADNAATRIAQGAKFGDEASAKVKAAQKKFGTKAVAKAEGDGEEPGSAAWEARDAAELRSVASQLAALRDRLEEAAERERAEVNSGADPDDYEDAWDLDDACQALDAALGIVARLTFTEQQEAASGGSVIKAGKRLSAKSVEALKTAQTHLSNAHNHITDLLGDAAQEDEPEGDDDMTKAEFIEALNARLGPLEADVKKALSFIEPPVPAGAKIDAVEDTGTLAAEEARQRTNDTPDNEMGGGTIPMKEPLAKPNHTYQQVEGGGVAKSTDQEALLKSVLEPMMKSVLAEGLSPLEKRLETIENQPMPGGPFLRGTDGNDYFMQRRAPAQPQLGAGGPEDLRKALDSVADPVQRDLLGRALAYQAHPFGGARQQP